MIEEMEERDGKGRFVKGNKAAQKYGAQLILDKGELPSTEEKESIQKHLDDLKMSLEQQVPERNAKAMLLIRQVVRFEAVIVHLELYLGKIGSLVDSNRLLKRSIVEVQPCLRELLQYLREQRHALTALDIHGDGLKLKTPMEVVAEIKEKRERKG